MTNLIRVLALVTLTLAAITCRDGAQTTIAPNSPVVMSQQPVDFSARMDRNGRFAQIAETIPGFGGLFKEDGQLVVRVKGPSHDLPKIRATIADFLYSDTRGNRALAEARRTQAMALIVRPADYDFPELLAWYRLILRQMPRSDLRAGSINSTKNRIVLSVPEDRVQAVTELIDDLPVDADAVLIKPSRGPLVLSTSPASTSLTGVVSPRVGGAKLDGSDFNGPCSLGFSVDRGDSNWYFVTASHCTTVIGSVTSDTAGQHNDSNRIGVEVLDPVYLSNADTVGCPVGDDCRYSDVSLFRYTTSDYTHGVVAWPGSPSTSWGTSGSTSFTETKRIIGESTPLEGDTVYMVGQKTGRSRGVLVDDCAVVSTGFPTYRTFFCVAIADYYGQIGDSGGPVVWWQYGYIAVGVHLGAFTQDSTTVYSRTTQWQAELGGTSCVTISCTPDPEATISGPSTVPPLPDCTWEADVTDGVPPYSYSWSGVLSGSAASITGSVSSSGYLNLTVTDDILHTDQTSLYITVDSGEPLPQGCEL